MQLLGSVVNLGCWFAGMRVALRDRRTERTLRIYGGPCHRNTRSVGAHLKLSPSSYDCRLRRRLGLFSAVHEPTPWYVLVTCRLPSWCPGLAATTRQGHHAAPKHVSWMNKSVSAI